MEPALGALGCKRLKGCSDQPERDIVDHVIGNQICSYCRGVHDSAVKASLPIKFQAIEAGLLQRCICPRLGN